MNATQSARRRGTPQTDTASTPAPAGEAEPLGIEPLDSYALIIDARSPREFADDHIPGALNLPVVDNGEYAQVGIMHKADPHRAYLSGVAWSLRNIADAIEPHIAPLPRKAPILVYCFRGGKRSRLWADALRTIGFPVTVLPGGWKRYRRWVIAQLDSMSRKLRLHVLSGPTGCGKTRLLHALAQVNEQVLDLEGIACHRGSVIGALPGVEQPPQKYFDSILLQRISGFDLDRPVWVEAESRKVGNLQLPAALHEAMHVSRCWHLEASMDERVRLWREDYRHFEEDPQELLAKLEHLVPLVGHQEFEQWKALADQHQMPALFERLMLNHYDPAYARSLRRNYGERDDAAVTLSLKGLDPDSLRQAALTIAAG